MALRLNVKILTGEMYSLDVSSNRTVWDFKLQISQKVGVSPYQQKLAQQNSTYAELRDGALISEYGLESGNTILLMVKNEESISVFLKTDKGRTNTYWVLPSDSVTTFKARVQQQENIRAEQMWLVYEGKPLEDGRKLSDYNIAPHGTIFLNLRLRGG
ncbi:ubiquitin-like protein ISG15 [Hemicordylus capensis]|uniref:ubiquitin-like protein ISG15 n=1 Tax=Hemicordylus capensis TaxID=884348 RepID=UPI002302FEF0|nr:ubiquitin-like protein ISG15 [Hemicordylus capensis]